MDNNQKGDLISREDLKKYARTRISEEIVTNQVILKLFDELIDDAPTVEEVSVIEFKEPLPLVKAQKIVKTLSKRPQGEWIDYSDEGYIECPFCGQATTCEDNIDELHYCWNCGAHLQKGGTDMRKPNCVTCDHFGKCEGCEKSEEE